MTLLLLLGIILCPDFTLGCLLIENNHPFLGTIALIISIFRIKFVWRPTNT